MDNDAPAEAEAEVEAVVGEVVEESENRRLPAVRQHEAMIARAEVTPAEVAGQRDKIKQVMDAVMTKGVHYGEIPGVSKPTLLKPGAEVLAVTLRLAPSYVSERIFHDDGHLTVVAKAKLTHIPTGLVIAEGEGLCSSREKKYAYRGEGRTCPACGAAGTIKKSKFPPRETDYPGARRSDAPGWYCHSKAGGCGANFAASDAKITEQSAEKVANPDLPDTWNTVLKMADKRALVAAILNGTAASDIFTQDVEDAGPSAADPHEASGATYDDGLYGAGETQQQGVPAYQPAQSWEELTDRLVGLLGKDEASQWAIQCIEVVAGSRDFGELSKEQKDAAFGVLVRVLKALDETEGDLQIRPDARDVVSAAFTPHLDGLVLAGPPWALTGQEAEEGRPQKADYLAQRTASG